MNGEIVQPVPQLLSSGAQSDYLEVMEDFGTSRENSALQKLLTSYKSFTQNEETL